MDFEVSAELVGIYLEDARSHLNVLDQVLLRLEREGVKPEVLTSVLGPLHTLKGNSGMMGFGSVKDYVHALEDVLGRLRDGKLVASPTVFDCLFAGASALRDGVERACVTGREERDLTPERDHLLELSRPAPDLASSKAVPAQAVSTVPASSPSPVPPTQSRSPLSAPSPSAVPAPQSLVPGLATGAEIMTTRSNLVRVDFAKLDHLLNLVGELIVQRTKLQDAGRGAASLLGDDKIVRDLLDSVHQLAGVSTQLQETIMDIRMLPIRNVFERFPRLVRDIARQQGKQVDLIVEGEETRVDKAIIDEIGEPLVHMIRNSVDHGLESPAERRAKGKSPVGTILLSAAQESNQVVITIADDGRGIDASAVRRKAIARGLLRADDVLTDREVIQFIFAEGFSTADSVTDLSGRGVGLDVVLKCTERLNGLIEAETMPGAGTKFTIQLPLTLAIISVLMVEVSGQTYALPSGSVVESLRFERAHILKMNGQDTLRLRDRMVPLVDLRRLFDLPEKKAREAYVVVVGRGEKRVGLTVDRLRGQQQVVIKALDPVVSGGAFGVAGATILGDGRVVLILDVSSFFGDRRVSAARASAPAGVS
jgi:two-component system, chemotaxis family, sensor kinase CheA